MIDGYSLLLQKQKVYVSRADGRAIYQGERSERSLNELVGAIVFDVQESYREGCSFDIEPLRSVIIKGKGDATVAEVKAVSTLINKKYDLVVEAIRRAPLMREPR